MKCPKCGESILQWNCSACQQPLPAESRYCCWCGEYLAGGENPVENVEPPATSEEEPVDLSSRLLCSDGTCIGVIGADGRCKECGVPYTGEPD